MHGSGHVLIPFISENKCETCYGHNLHAYILCDLPIKSLTADSAEHEEKDSKSKTTVCAMISSVLKGCSPVGVISCKKVCTCSIDFLFFKETFQL